MKELRRNMRIVGTIVVIAFIGLASWFALTAYEQGTMWASDSYNTRLKKSNSQRGDIYDRYGTVLATVSDGQRVYLSETAARRALAATLGDTAGLSGTGVEGYYSAQLLDLSESMLERLSAVFNGAPRKGSSVRLTVDAALTAYVSSIFPSGSRGAVVILNYRTGEILAMVSKPDYDPANLSATVEDTAYLNRCLQGRYTPGSVFKIVTLTSALENDPNVVGQSFVCNGTWEYEGGRIVCASGRTAHGTVDLKTAFAKSCNVSFGKLAYQLGLTRLRDTAERLGFNENFKLGDFALYNSQFPTEIGNMSDLVWAGIGQGTVLVTPMHMAMITSAVANNGMMMKPYLVKDIITAAGVTTKTGASQEYRQVMSASVAQTVSAYMYEAVQSGTAKRAAVKGYTVCGKTGSAETSDDKSVETNSWYTGFVMDSAHPYAIAVVIEQGGAGSRLASELASDALAMAIQRN